MTGNWTIGGKLFAGVASLGVLLLTAGLMALLQWWTSASMEEMAAMTRKNADNASTASALVESMVEQARTSNAALGEKVTQMAAAAPVTRHRAAAVSPAARPAIKTARDFPLTDAESGTPLADTGTYGRF